MELEALYEAVLPACRSLSEPAHGIGLTDADRFSPLVLVLSLGGSAGGRREGAGASGAAPGDNIGGGRREGTGASGAALRIALTETERFIAPDQTSEASLCNARAGGDGAQDDGAGSSRFARRMDSNRLSAVDVDAEPPAHPARQVWSEATLFRALDHSSEALVFNSCGGSGGGSDGRGRSFARSMASTSLSATDR